MNFNWSDLEEIYASASGYFVEAGEYVAQAIRFVADAVAPAVAWTRDELDAADVDWRIAALLAVGLAILVLVLLVRRRRQHEIQPSDISLSSYVRGPRRLGWATIFLVFGGLGGLSASVPLSGAAIAPGVISPDGARKSVQHLEGGIVRHIHVREGDAVEVGQLLVTLEDIRARANLAELEEKLVHFSAVEARLRAEQEDASEIEPPQLVEAYRSMLDAAMRGQRDLFESRRLTRAGRERIYGQRILQVREENAGLRETIAAQDEQIALIEQEAGNVRELYEKGLERLPRLLALQRAQAELRGAQAANRARVARNEQVIGQTELEVLTSRQIEQERVSEELASVRAELASLRSRLPDRSDVLARTTIHAPVSGTVVNLRLTTEGGGVLSGGEPILDIVPSEALLIVDARLRPVDIDVVHPGMPAKVVLSAFTQRNLPQITGTLRSVSADRFVDERTGEPYYLAKVEIDPDQLTQTTQELELVAGMPADVFIITGERTALDYLIRPFVLSFMKSFKES